MRLAAQAKMRLSETKETEGDILKYLNNFCLDWEPSICNSVTQCLLGIAVKYAPVKQKIPKGLTPVK